MAEAGDGFVDLEHGSGSIHEGVGEVAMDVPSTIHEQSLARLSSTGAMAHENFTTFMHILNLKYETDRHTVSLVESLGIREVTSASGQAGIPAGAK